MNSIILSGRTDPKGVGLQGFPPEIAMVIEAYDASANQRGHVMRWQQTPAGHRGCCARCGGVARLHDDLFEFGATGDPREMRCDRLLELD